MLTLSQRRARANAIAAKQGPVTQASIDARWSALAEQLNASGRHTPVDGRTSPPPASRAPESQAAIDARWSSIVADLNKRSGRATPIADRSR
jgi:hypothetical protein